MILIYLLLHILIQPVYADEASPSATPIATVTEIPTPELSPIPTTTPTVSLTQAPELTVTPTPTETVTQAPIESPTPTVQQTITTPAPTHTPVFSNQVTSPTPPPTKPVQLIAHVMQVKTIPLVNQFAQIINFPKDFFRYSEQGNYYQSTKLSPDRTRQLLSLSALLFVAGLLLLFWDSLAALTFRLFKRKQFVYAVNEIAQESG